MSFAPEQHAARSVRTAGRTLLTSISQSTREQSCPNRNQSRESPLPLKQTGNYDLMVRSETDRASSRGLPGQVPTPPQRRLGARSLRDDRDSVRDGVSGFRGVRSRGSERLTERQDNFSHWAGTSFSQTGQTGQTGRTRGSQTQTPTAQSWCIAGHPCTATATDGHIVQNGV